MAWECPESETLAVAAATLPECYLAAGFTRHEALHLVSGNPCRKRDDSEFE